MTLDEAKDAVQHRKRVIFNGAEYIANGIITWWDNHSGVHQGWRNSLDLIAVNGSSSCTQALVRECTLVEGGVS